VQIFQFNFDISQLGVQEAEVIAPPKFPFFIFFYLLGATQSHERWGDLFETAVPEVCFVLFMCKLLVFTVGTVVVEDESFWFRLEAEGNPVCEP
jgi:hypothetical protein